MMAINMDNLQKDKLIMKKEYRAPESKVIEVKAEGFLCMSGDPKGATLETYKSNETSIWG